MYSVASVGDRRCPSSNLCRSTRRTVRLPTTTTLTSYRSARLWPAVCHKGVPPRDRRGPTQVARAAAGATARMCSTILSGDCATDPVESGTREMVAAETNTEYTAMLLGATGNVGGQILRLLEQSSLCRQVVVVTRRRVADLANPKVRQVVVNMDNLTEELAPHATGVDIAIAAFGVGKGSAKMADEEVR